MPRRSRITLEVCVGAAVLMVGAVVATRPNIGPAIDHARPLDRRLVADGGNLGGGPAPT